MNIRNVGFKLYIILTCLLIVNATSQESIAARIGNNYEQQMPIEGVTLPTVSIEPHPGVNPGETLDVAVSEVNVDTANGGKPFYYWYADKGSFAIHPSYPDYSMVKYTAPDTSGIVNISVRVGDTLGYVAKDTITITVGKGTTVDPGDLTPPVNEECTYTVSYPNWQQVYHTEYLLTAERTANYKPTGHFRVQPVFDDMLWDYSGQVQVIINGSAVTLYEDPNLQTEHGHNFGYHPGGQGFEFWFDADFSSHKSITLHHSEDSQSDGWDTVWMMKADCPTDPPVQGDPDLQIDAYEVKPSYAEAGQEVQFRVRVRNIGDGTSGPCKIGYYLADNGNFTELYEDYIGSLNPGMTSIREPFIRLPANLGNGQYEIAFKADDGNKVPEINENNNDRFATLIIGTGASEADLIVDSYTFSADSVVPGESVTMGASVKNIGGSGTSAASRIGYFLSEDPYYDASDILLGTNYFGFLLPGAGTEIFNRTFILPGTLKTGQTYYILFYADYEDKVVEEDESPNNNIAARSITVSYSEEMTVFQPEGNSEWGHDRTYDIIWTSNLGGTVKIELYKSISPLMTIAAAAANSGTYQWTVPSELQVLPDTEKQYWIKITANADSSVSDDSERFRVVYSDSLTVLSPKAGEEWGYGTSRNIRWNSTFDGKVEIQLYKDGKYFQTVDNAETSRVRDCDYIWLVPSDIPQGISYQIRIVNAGDEQTAGISPEFSIAAIPPEEISVTVPDTEITETDTPVSISVLLNDNPPIGEKLYVDAVTQAQNGSVVINGDFRTVTYTPNPGFSGEDSFTYTCNTFKEGASIAQVFVTVVNSSGSSWLNHTSDSMNSIATDNTGNVFVTDGGNIEKYNASGELQWTRKIEGAYSYSHDSLATDNAGNVYIVGSWSSDSPLVFYTDNVSVNTVNASNTGGELFIAKYDSAGTLLWAQASQGAYDDFASAIAVDANAGSFYISGQFDGEITLGSGAYASTLIAEGSEFFLAKFSLDGTLRWAKQISGEGGNILALSVDASGDILCTGHFDELAVFPGTSPITLNGTVNTDNLFVAKFDASGNVKWAQKATGSSNIIGMDICTDTSGAIYTTGVFDRGISFFQGSTSVMTLAENPQRNRDIFLAKYSAEGGILWAESVRSSGDDYSYAVGTDNSGNPLIAGFIGSGAVFGKDTSAKTVILQSSSGFIASYTPEGEFISVATAIGGSEYLDMHVNRFGHIHIVGSNGENVHLATSDHVFELTTAGNFVAKLIDPESLDHDGDGIRDEVDVFPNDPAEWEDTDGDGAGNNADADDDDDGMPDAFEISNGFDPLNASDALADPDSDGYTNLEEFQLGTDPHKENTDSPSRWIWGRQSVGADAEGGYALAADKNGNVFAVGMIRAETTFGNITHTPEGWGIFTAKYDSEGNCLWVSSAKLGGNYGAYGITTDNAGNVYVAGYFQWAAYFGNTALTSNAQSMDIFIAKYSGTNGNLLWVKQGGGSDTDYVQSMTSDGVNLYITGRFYGASQFGGKSVSSKGSSDVFIAKYDANGNCLWVQSGGGTDSDYGRCIAADTSGNLFVTGNFKGSAVFGNTTLVSKGNADIFLAKYSTNGVLQWVKSAGGASTDYGYSVSTDPAGNVYIAGQITTSAIFGTLSVTAGGAGAGVLAKYNANGNPLWIRTMSASGTDYAYTYAVSTVGTENIGVRGYFSGMLTLGTETLSAQEAGNNFIAVYNSNGEFQWEDHAATASSSYACQSIVFDGSEGIYATGTFNQNLTLGKDTLYPTGGSSSDFFIGKLGNSATTGTLSGFTLTPPIQEVPEQSGTVSFQVKKVGSSPVVWTVESDASPWFSIQSGGSGTDDGIITVSYQSNSGKARTGILTIGSDTSGQSINVEIRQTATTDSDGDGVSDKDDAFPNDPNESIDSDGDGIGNNADTDDDNDGMSDTFEQQYGLNPLNPGDASTDMDNDGFSNLAEYQADTDPTDPESKPEEEITQEIPLTAGWNLISLNVFPEDMRPSQVFASVSDKLLEVKNISQTYDPALPDFLNTLTELEDGMGYWVNVSQDVMLSVSGLPADLSALSIPLKAGWNLTGYPGQNAAAITEALAGIMGVLTEVKSISESYDPAVPEFLNTLTELRPGSGYWINVSSDTWLNYPAGL